MPAWSCGSRLSSDFNGAWLARMRSRDRMCLRQFAFALTVEFRQDSSEMESVLRLRVGFQPMAKRDVLSSVFRGACARCPNCGRGRLFRAYLKPVESCAECHESLKHIRADDGPAWLTILVVGHIVGALALHQEM